MEINEENVARSISNMSTLSEDSNSNARKHSAERDDKRVHKRNIENKEKFSGKRKKFQVSRRLKEVDVGITEYSMDHEGFSGTIKERYSDFHVHEIALDGQIAKLNSQELPPELNDLEDIEKIRENVPEDVQTQIFSLSDNDSSVSSIRIDVTSMNKLQRRAIHVMVKTIPNTVSQTETIEGKKMIIVSKMNSLTDCQVRKDKRVDWSKRGGDYCHFLVHKINIDTIDALNRMTSFLRLRPNSFSYAGTKDRRGKTTQWVSVKKIDPQAILRAGRSIRGLFVGNFKFDKSPLKLGMLRGNRFTIVLRNVIDNHEKIEKAMISLRDNGFINYYGLQRFGTVADIPTHEIGRALLQGKWLEAINLILKPREDEQDSRLAEARRIYNETGNSKAAYKKLDRTDRIEAKILWAIGSYGINDPQAVLSAVPRNIILIYLHAYQSFIWNQIVSRRLREYGKEPIIGDLVYENLNTQQINGNSDLDNLESLDENSIEENESQHSSPKVKFLEQDDLAKYCLADVIMPQPGWRVVYPPYAKTWYEEFLEKDGLTTDLKQKNKQYTLGGSYRKILQIPLDLSWKIAHYNGKSEDLIASDIDELRVVHPSEDVNDGKYKALIIEMSLPSSTYATMALREILKSDTSAQSQAAQSAIHEGNEEEEEEEKEEGERIINEAQLTEMEGK